MAAAAVARFDVHQPSGNLHLLIDDQGQEAGRLIRRYRLRPALGHACAEEAISSRPLYNENALFMGRMP
jgi:hypothetical protein